MTLSSLNSVSSRLTSSVNGIDAAGDHILICRQYSGDRFNAHQIILKALR